MTDFELLENVLSIHCRTILKNFQPGVTSEYLNANLNDKSLNFERIRALYTWRNGFREAYKPCYNKHCFHTFGNFFPIEKALQIGKQFYDEGVWKSNLFPIITNNDGDYLLIDLDEESSTYGFLYIFSTSMLLTEPITIYDSFSSFIKSVGNCYSSGSYKYNNKTDELTVNFEHEKIFSAAINPLSDYWKE